MTDKYKRSSKTGRYIESGEAEMAERPISVRLPADLDAKVRAMPDRTKFLREAIAKALEEAENFQSA
jgi:predicted DNA-binding protein